MQTRMFPYPLSFLVYSAALTAFPDRPNIREILLDTKTNFAAAWH